MSFGDKGEVAVNDDATGFSVTQRLFLSNQYRILEKVDPDNSVEHVRKAVILESGFEGHYQSITNLLVENRLPADECWFVAEIMLMCSWLQDHKGLSSLDVSEFEQVGFDANNEWHHMQYASFLFDANTGGYPGIDSVVDVHHPTLDRYRRMVAAWKRANNLPHLTEADVARILSSGLNLD